MPEPIGTAAALRSAYSAGELTTLDVADRVLTALGDRTGNPIWISTVPAAQLRARAAELYDRRDEMAALPLYGVPFAVKDNIDLAGLPTTAGCPEFAYRPDRTAGVLTRLLDAGAMLVGKTNLDQFATGLTGTRSPYGTCESVFGGGLIAGGSSSGSAVAVATGLVSFTLGTDTAGSGRVPAACNGIVGMKPSRGLLSVAGVVPACRSLDCVSIFTHTPDDADTVFRVACGVDPDDPWARPLPADRSVARPPGTLRLGLPRAEDLDFFGDLGQRDRFTVGQDRVAALVGETEPVGLRPLFEAGDLLYQGPWVAERLADLDDFLRRRPEAVLPVTRKVLEAGRRYDAAQVFRARHRLQELRAWADRLWRRIDVLVVPTVGTTFTIEEIDEDPIGRNTMLGRYTQFANLLDLAAVTVPNGFTEAGRPASLTLVGPAFSDITLIQLAAALTVGPTVSGPAVAEPTLSSPTPSGPSVPGPTLSGPSLSGPGLRGPSVPGPTPAARTAAGGSAATVAGSSDAFGDDWMLLAVVGRHLSGESRNAELIERDAILAGVGRTAPLYRLYRLPSEDGVGLPTLVRVGPADGAAIEIELWRLPVGAIGGLLAGVPAPLSLGWLRLHDGREVLGFLGEAYAADDEVEDITATGGWRAYRQATRTGRPSPV
ncbi:allophanate hydrolase [Plantactinospora soyae]|uniref:Allophanate hydrolase n=1 Tax=Plantactinospora soyae TaxID=1544732 RepID=A0A927M9Z7_9ACTN|nr:allophanate hydrolase [Plantactinospora soyae]MBE1490579.1 allophanate hydrolase [Plantactinospora soyae]